MINIKFLMEHFTFIFLYLIFKIQCRFSIHRTPYFDLPHFKAQLCQSNWGTVWSNAALEVHSFWLKTFEKAGVLPWVDAWDAGSGWSFQRGYAGARPSQRKQVETGWQGLCHPPCTSPLGKQAHQGVLFLIHFRSHTYTQRILWC